MHWMVRKALNAFRSRRTIIALHLLWLFALYVHQGILSDKEALKYLGCAGDVIQGDLTDLLGNYLKYSGYVLFLVPFVALGVPPLAVLVQVVLGILSARALAGMVERTTGKPAHGTLAMAIFLFCYPVQVWTLALYTESFYTSMALLFLDRVTRQRVPVGQTILLGALTLITRPVGMFVVGPVLIMNRFAGLPNVMARKLRWPLYACVLLLAIGLPGIPRPQLEPIVDAHIIAGVPEGPSVMEGFHGSSIGAAQWSLMERMGFSEWTGLFLRRVASLLTPVRPYYSMLHNLLAGPVVLLYPFAVLGFARWGRIRMGEILSVVLTLNVFLVGLTHDEWSGRFLAPLLPLIIAMAVMGLTKPTDRDPINPMRKKKGAA